MDFTGQKVRHISFGNGTVISHKNQAITVRFDSSKEMDFQFPKSFKTFLAFMDSELDAYAKEAVRQGEAESARIEAEKETKKAAELAAIQKMNPGKSHFSKPHTDFKVEHFSSVEGFVEYYKSKISAEIHYLKFNGGKKQRLSDGKLIDKRNSRYYYIFESDSELFYPDETPIKIWLGSTGIDAKVIACEELTITFSTRTNMGESVSSVEISADPWMLLGSLNDRLDKISASAHSPIVKSLICDSKINYNAQIVKGQDNACRMALSQPITFIWGPPGTGKTETLARIALEHIKKGSKVLMLSYSNVSVDGALKRVFSKAPQTKPGQILRFGYPRDEFLLNHDYLTVHNYVLYHRPELLKRMKDLLKLLKESKNNPAQHVKYQEDIQRIRKKFKTEEEESVKQARFVATTVSKAIADKVVFNQNYDVVIFDEASMAYIPQIIYSASLAQKHFICMGDFSQLPPIAQNPNDEALSADIFQYCGITQAVNRNCGHDWLCMLDVQYRMHPEIAKLASRVMYKSLLKTAEGIESERKSISNYSPFLNQPIAVADLSGMASVCTKTSDSSRINLLSALITFGLAIKTAKRNEVGIITPYNAQSRLLRAMARDAMNADPSLKPITTATVHQFQGSEKDVIIFDAVDCYLQKYPGTLLTLQNNDYANRLFNVALTRARGKFVAVANKGYLFDKNISHNLMFTKLLIQNSEPPRCSDGSTIKKEIFCENKTFSWLDDANAERIFLSDFIRAKKEIRIDIPGSLTDKASFLKRLNDEIESLKKRGIKVFIRVKSKDCLPDFMRKHAIVNNYIYNPITIIDNSIVWFGMPSSGFDFVAEGRTINTKFRPKIRFEGAFTAKSIYGFIEMNRTIDQAETFDDSSDSDTFAQYVSTHKLCSECGKPMKLKYAKGGYFLGCSSYPGCNHTEQIDSEFVEQYFSTKGPRGMRCPKCGLSLEALNGYYGVYIQCCGLNKHKFKLNEI